MPTVTSKYGDEEALEALVPSFEDRLGQETASLVRHSLDSVQINVGKQCNQACLHCHVEAGPQRVEIMDQRTAELAIEFACLSGAQTVEITGGAPELNPSFRYMVGQLRQAGLRVIDRSNLTVFFEPGQEDLPSRGLSQIGAGAVEVERAGVWQGGFRAGSQPGVQPTGRLPAGSSGRAGG